MTDWSGDDRRGENHQLNRIEDHILRVEVKVDSVKDETAAIRVDSARHDERIKSVEDFIEERKQEVAMKPGYLVALATLLASTSGWVSDKLGLTDKITNLFK